jgi:hypothetical protein
MSGMQEADVVRLVLQRVCLDVCLFRGMTMKIVKYSVCLALLAGALVTPAGKTAREMASVVWNWVQVGSEQAIPVEMQLARLELKLKDADSEIDGNQRTMVEQAVNIDRYARQVRSEIVELASLRNSLRTGRDQYVKVECQETRGRVGSDLKANMASYKARSQKLDAMTSTLKELKSAHAQMQAGHQELCEQRDELARRVDVMRTKVAAMKMTGQLDRTALSDSSIRDADALADRIDRKLEVQKRLAEGRTGLEGDDIEAKPTVAGELDLNELDSLLGT